MEIPFLTISKYDGQLLSPQFESSASQGSDQGVRWEKTDQAPAWAAGATAQIFRDRGDRLVATYKLDYPDINGLGNSIFRLDGEQFQFCLKVLGNAEGNERETLVWEALGYGGNGDRFQQIKGLPPSKFTVMDKQLRTVLTPYYPGVLKAISGDAYEFPLVICAALYIEETLAGLHERGLAYMDLCPSNILFKTNPNEALLFFLTDMGGVKPLARAAHRPELAPLVEVMVARRWTRREVLPPVELFGIANDPRFEASPAYDYYTLGRTCQVLLGLGPEQANQDTRQWSGELCLEDPMRATRAEMTRFDQLIQPWFSGQAPDGEARLRMRGELERLFVDFFSERQNFACGYLGRNGIGARWRATLLGRLRRYRMALPAARFEELHTRLDAALDQAEAQYPAELAALTTAVAQLRQGDPAALTALETFAASRLVKVSRVANYALFHHKKLARILIGDASGRLAALGANLPNTWPLAEEPEVAISRELRRLGRALPLGVLRRQV